MPSGFGQSGPYTARAAFNPVGLAFGGITYLNGWPDRRGCFELRRESVKVQRFG